MTDMKILITGASGLIGQALSKELIARGHTTVAAVRRSPRRNDEVQWDPQSGVMSPDAFQGVDAVVHLCRRRNWRQTMDRLLQDGNS